MSDADVVNAYSSGDGRIVVAFRIDGEWQDIWVTLNDADQLTGMLDILTRGAPGRARAPAAGDDHG